MIRRMITLPILITLAILAYAWLAPSESTPERITFPTPTASTPSYPACTEEDGAGQALCYWDADTQGNGQGTDAVSGDCADVQGTAYLNSCLALHAKPSHEVPNEDGSMRTVPNGVDLVGECNEINREMNQQDRIESGFNLGECYKAQMNS